MKKFLTDLRKHAAETNGYEKKEVLVMIDEETESYINQNFLNICKKNVYNVEDSNDDSNDDGDNQEFDNRWFYCNSAGRDDVDDDYYDQDDRDDHDAHELMVEGFIVVLQDLLVL